MVLTHTSLRWFFSCMLGLLLAGAVVRGAQADTGLSYEVMIDAPEPLAKLLENNLEIVHWREDPRMNLDQLERLHAQTPAAMRELLATEGYYTPQIDSSLEPATNGWIARYRVIPGETVRVSEVNLNIVGPLATQPSDRDTYLKQMHAAWRLPVDRPFRQADWESAKRGALAVLLIDRFPTARIVDSQAVVDPQRQRAVLNVTIDSGPAFRFGMLHITGLRRYPQTVIDRLNPMQPGEPYSQSKLLELQSRLQNSPYFSGAEVTAETTLAHVEGVPVHVEVTESQSRKLGFGIGASSNTGARGSIEYRDLNFFDQAWRFSSVLKLEQKKQSLNGEIQFPLTREGYRDTVTAVVERSTIEGETLRKLNLGAKRARAKGNIETAFGLQYILEKQSVKGSQGETRQSLAPSYAWTQRDVDDQLYPSQGMLINLQVAGGAKALLSDQNFVHTYGRLIYFLPFGPRNTLMLRGEAGMVGATSRDGIPSDFLFRTGGDQTVRGYAYQSLGVKEGEAIVGGRYLAVASAEYVRWITPAWGAAIFYDAGNANDDLRSFEFKLGYGLGARWKSPVGPINLDLAYGEATREVRLHFSVGFSF